MTWWTSITVALIMSAPAGFLAWLAWYQRKDIKAIKTQGIESHKLMNSRLSELLKITRKSALAKGRLEGRAEEKKRNKTKD